MSYVVLARKWRPQSFEDLTGQEHVARTLRNAIERDRVPHALLFTGARGVGKTSSARILAMALNCERGRSPIPCGECSSCVEIQQGRSTDVLEIDGASNRGINEIRELRDGVRYAPQRDRSKIYIIDEVHMLTTEAFNALLKTLEEPPPHVVFIFATTEAQKIPVTILSRCQRFDFRRIGHRDIVDRLAHIVRSEGIAVDEDVLGLIARQAAGGMRDALSLLDQVIAFSGDGIDIDTVSEILGAADRRRLFDLSEAVLRRDREAALDVLDVVMQHGTDPIHFTAEWVSHLRDLNVVAAAPDARHLTTLTDSEHDDALAQASATHPSVLHRAFECMVGEAETISRAAWPRLVLEMAVLRLCDIESVHRVEELISRLEHLAAGHRLPSGAAAAPVETEPRDGGGVGRKGPRGRASAAGAARREPGGETEEEPSPADAPVAAPAADPPSPAATHVPAEAPPADAAALPVHGAVGGRAEEQVSPGSVDASGPGDGGVGATAPERIIADVRAEVSAGPVVATFAPDGSSTPSGPDCGEAEGAANASAAAGSVSGPQPSPAAPTERDAASRRAAEDDVDEPLPEAGMGAEASPVRGEARITAGREVPEGEAPRAASLALWREVVALWDEQGSPVGRLLARGWLLDAGGSTIRLALPGALLEQLRPGVLDAVASELGSRTGRAELGIGLVEVEELTSDELDQGLQLLRLEEEEREAQRAAIRERMAGHPAVREILDTWPAARASYTINEDEA